MEYSSWPDDLVREVLLRLPVQSLFRFKSTCKNWYSRITNSCFVREHLHHKDNPTRLLILILIYRPPSSQCITNMIMLPGGSMSPDHLEKPSYIHIPRQLDEIIGPVDGLFFACKYNKDVYEKLNYMALWNPATREFRPLPPYFPKVRLPPFYDEHTSHHSFGFGFDPLNQDYKVVCLSSFWSKCFNKVISPMFAAVYSLSNVCWTDLTCNFDPNIFMKNSLCSACVNGVYYWCAIRKYSEYADPNTKYRCPALLRFFDMHNETFGEIPGPNIYTKCHYVAFYHLAQYKEFICLMVPHDDEKMYKMYPPIDIWLMKDEKSWIKLLNAVPATADNMPLGFWGHDKFIFQNGNNVVMYDSETNKLAQLFKVEECDVRVISYTESLVSIRSKKYV